MRMTRRQFVAAAALAPLAPLAGCGRGGPDRSGMTWDSIQREIAVRAGHLAEVRAAAKSPPGATPPPPVDVLKTAPELKGLIKLTHRLHPRLADDLRADESGLGGPLLWPDGEAWPATEAGNLLVPVLQLRAEDAPPQATFRPGSDLVQVFWDARAALTKGPHLTGLRVVWRKRADVGAVAAHPLAGLGADPDNPAWRTHWLTPQYVPVPCRFAPERVLEFPNLDVLPERVRGPLLAKLPGGEAAYRDAGSVAPGTKVGGYAPSLRDGLPPACPTCRWGMDYFLTVDDREWSDTGAARWRPAGATDSAADRRAVGLWGGAHVFVCRRCPDWPAALG